MKKIINTKLDGFNCKTDLNKLLKAFEGRHVVCSNKLSDIIIDCTTVGINRFGNIERLRGHIVCNYGVFAVRLKKKLISRKIIKKRRNSLYEILTG